MKLWFLLDRSLRPNFVSASCRHPRRAKSVSSMIRHLALLTLVVVAAVTGSPILGQLPLPEAAHLLGDEPLQMVVDYGQGPPKRRQSRHGVMEPVGLPIGQQVSITLKFLPTRAGQKIAVSTLDGGKLVLEQPTTIAVDGTAMFRFTAGATPGLYRLQVYGTEPYELRLYAFDPNAPRPSRRH